MGAAEVNAWTWGWIAIIGIGVVYEIVAIVRNEGNTLSENTWRFEKHAKVLRWLVGGALLWAAVHFVSMGRFG